jgi:hypothetical protein
MRSVLSLTTFALWVLCFVVFLTKVRPAPIIAMRSPSEQVQVQRCVQLFGCVLKAKRNCSDKRCL